MSVFRFIFFLKLFFFFFWGGGGSFLEGFVGFLVVFSKGDGMMVGGDGGKKEKAVKEKKT